MLCNSDAVSATRAPAAANKSLDPKSDYLHVSTSGPFPPAQHLLSKVAIGLLITVWVFSSICPFLIAFLLYRGYIVAATCLLLPQIYALLVEIKPWPFAIWLLGSATRPHEFYQPHGTSVTFEEGALRAIRHEPFDADAATQAESSADSAAAVKAEACAEQQHAPVAKAEANANTEAEAKAEIGDDLKLVPLKLQCEEAASWPKQPALPPPLSYFDL